MNIQSLVAAGAVDVSRQRHRPQSPAELAQRLIPGYKVTPAVQLMSEALGDVITGTDKRLIVTVSPREGKSTLVSVIGTLYALYRNPNTKIILATYSDSLSWELSRTARELVSEHSDLLGFRLSPDRTSAGRWTVDNHSGGLLAVGIGSSITGFGADLLLVDDAAAKNATEADSAAQRRKVLAEFRSTLLTRVHPGGGICLIGARWHTDDLIGSLLREEPERWQYLNIPAVSEEGIPDALDRPPGVAMTSALGRTPEQFDDIRRSVGSRSWYALFQGVPSSPEGGLVQRDWLEQHRLPAAPAHPIRTVVAVDPADSGERDAAGIVAASLGADGVVSMIADATGKMTSDEWSRAAIELADKVGASEIHVEAFSAGTTYVRIVREALTRQGTGRPIRVTGWPPKGSPRKGDAVARAASVLTALEVGTCRLAGNLPEFEQAATSWQAGQHQPDALAALVIAHDVLAPVAGQQVQFVSPLDISRRITDRPSVPATATTRRHLSRSVKGARYDALSFPRKTLRG